MNYRLVGTLRAVNQRLFHVRKFTNCSNIMDRLTLFQSIGLSEQKSRETIKNEALAKRLETIIAEVRGMLFCLTLWEISFVLKVEHFNDFS